MEYDYFTWKPRIADQHAIGFNHFWQQLLLKIYMYLFSEVGTLGGCKLLSQHWRGRLSPCCRFYSNLKWEITASGTGALTLSECIIWKKWLWHDWQQFHRVHFYCLHVHVCVSVTKIFHLALSLFSNQWHDVKIW